MGTGYGLSVSADFDGADLAHTAFFFTTDSICWFIFGQQQSQPRGLHFLIPWCPAWISLINLWYYYSPTFTKNSIKFTDIMLACKI